MGVLFFLLKLIFCFIPGSFAVIFLWGLISDGYPEWKWIGPMSLGVFSLFFFSFLSGLENGEFNAIALIISLICLILGVVMLAVFFNREK